MQIIPFSRPLLLVVLAANTACVGKIEQEPGFYYICNGDAANAYYSNGFGDHHEFEVCLGPNYYYGTGGPDQSGDTGEIDLATWVNDADDLDQLQQQCTNECLGRGDGAHCTPAFPEPTEWLIKNYAGHPLPDIGITDPWHLGCPNPKAKVAPNPWATTVVPTGSSPIWPSNRAAISVACTDYQNCDEEFDAPIRDFLFYDGNSVMWNADMGYADYAMVSKGTSTLEITIENPGATPSSDWYDADGRVEYSASDCGDAACPFYLANLTLSNSTDTWELYSEDLQAAIYIDLITAQLRGPTLGVWETSTGEFYLGEERIELYVTGTVTVGSGLPMEHTYLVANVDAIFGEIGDGGEIEIRNFVAGDSSFQIEADLDYDTLAGSPPTADHGMGSTVTAPTMAGLPISYLTDVSSDPDNDINSKYWFVDGIERVPPYVIPLGLHTIALVVMDDRQAYDLHQTSVEVLSP